MLHVKVQPKIRVRGVHSPLTSYHVKILGGYPLSATDNKVFKIKKVFSDAAIKFKHKNVIIDCAEEPLLFATRDHLENKTPLCWFDFLHDVADSVEFPIENIIFLTSNFFINQSYDNWCNQKNITEKMKVFGPEKNMWIKRQKAAGHKYLDTSETKHLTFFLGRPTLFRNKALYWYLKNISGTDKESRMLSTFFYENFILPDDWNLTEEELHRFNNLQGYLEDDLKVPVWRRPSEKFIYACSLGLFNLNIDYHEGEDFRSIEDYKNFKELNSWWKEESLSEKMFRMVLHKKPFLKFSAKNSLKRFQSWGFKTFDKILFDESYDDIDDDLERLSQILNQAEKLLELPFETLKEKIYSSEVQAVLDYNYQLALELSNEEEKNYVI